MVDVTIRGPMGLSGTDRRLDINWQGAGSVDFERSMYGLWIPAYGPAAQAVHFCDIYNLYTWEDVPAGDFEIAPSDGRNVANEIQIYLETIRDILTIRPRIYTSATWWNKWVGWQPWAAQFELWTAGYPGPQHVMHYPDEYWAGYTPKGWEPGHFDIWQFGTLPGKKFGVKSSYMDANWARV